MRRHARDDRARPGPDARHRGRRRRRRPGRRVGLIPPAFSSGTLDRAAHLRRDPEALAALRARPDALVVVSGREGLGPEPLALQDREPAAFLGLRPDGVPVFAARARDGDALQDLRALAPQLDPERAGLLAYATSVLRWQAAHRFCARCGGPLELREAGFLGVCEQGHQSHPRTDPVVIMLVLDGPRCLLGRQASWPAGRWSALAGFVEPGETLEAAVAREVREEAGVRVRDARYVASQPWPFPASLMLGFEAQYDGGEVELGDDELEDARWFTRDQLAREDGVLLPPPQAIARTLLDRWLARTAEPAARRVEAATAPDPTSSAAQDSSPGASGMS